MDIRKIQNYVKVMRRRCEFLSERINSRPDNAPAHHDIVERNALWWATKYIEDTILEASDYKLKENPYGETN